jgi:hypothetical protein
VRVIYTSSRAKHFAIALLELMGLTRFELVTPRLSSVCSNQLSYRPPALKPSRRLSKNPTVPGSFKTR